VLTLVFSPSAKPSAFTRAEPSVTPTVNRNANPSGISSANPSASPNVKHRANLSANLSAAANVSHRDKLSDQHSATPNMRHSAKTSVNPSAENYTAIYIVYNIVISHRIYWKGCPCFHGALWLDTFHKYHKRSERIQNVNIKPPVMMPVGWTVWCSVVSCDIYCLWTDHSFPPVYVRNINQKCIQTEFLYQRFGLHSGDMLWKYRSWSTVSSLPCRDVACAWKYGVVKSFNSNDKEGS
jgi:hypothetical protein